MPSLIQAAASGSSAGNRALLLRKNSIQMIESEKLPPVTEGVAMGRDELPQSTGDLAGASSQTGGLRPGSLLAHSRRITQRRQSSTSSASGSQDNVANSSSVTSLSGASSGSGSTTSQRL